MEMQTKFVVEVATPGAGGPIGSRLVQEALGRGHAVMATVHDLEKVQPCLPIAYSRFTQ